MDGIEAYLHVGELVPGISPTLREWLMKLDEPSVRLRVLLELEDRPPTDAEVVAEQSRIGEKGWAARILSLQLPDGHWGSPGATPEDLYNPKYIVTNWQLLVLSDLGAHPDDPRVQRAIALVWDRWGVRENALGGSDSELCITGNAVRYLSRLGDPNDPRLATPIDWLLRTQKPDGGWHCFDSPTGTLDCWEALAAFAALPRDRWTEPIHRSVERGAEFYLARALLNEGGAPYAPWYRIHYPNHYYYDFLVGLDTLTRLGYGSDPRLATALDLLESKRNPDGSWNLEAVHPDGILSPEEIDQYTTRMPRYPYLLELPGGPSRWITVTALAVLRRAGRL